MRRMPTAGTHQFASSAGANGASGGTGGGFNRAVRSLVSLGAPHLAPPADVRDMTGGALTWVNERWPGARAPDGVTTKFTPLPRRSISILHLCQLVNCS